MVRSKILKFETVYKNAREYALNKKAGARLEDQRSFDKYSVDFERFVYSTFKQEMTMMLGIDHDRDASEFDVNQDKTYSQGRRSLKVLCRELYLETVKNLHSSAGKLN